MAVWRGQDDLSCPRAVSRSQNKLLFGSSGRLHRCHYLDLLTGLLVSYNLKVLEMKVGDRDRGMWTLTWTSEVKVKNTKQKSDADDTWTESHVVTSTRLLLLLMCREKSTRVERQAVTCILCGVVGGSAGMTWKRCGDPLIIESDGEEDTYNVSTSLNNNKLQQ